MKKYFVVALLVVGSLNAGSVGIPQQQFQGGHQQFHGGHQVAQGGRQVSRGGISTRGEQLAKLEERDAGVVVEYEEDEIQVESGLKEAIRAQEQCLEQLKAHGINDRRREQCEQSLHQLRSELERSKHIRQGYQRELKINDTYGRNKK